MASSSSPGRARHADDAAATAPAGLTGLGNRFVELFGRKLSRRTFAVETARLIAMAVRVRAVAVLGYDRRRDRLVLLAEHGLRPEARVVLGGGADCTWDIPMRALRNRRIAVVEAAHQNPFVPPSLVELSPAGLCIASVPLYYDYDPVGVVLLFAASGRAFPDAHLQTLSQALRVCARGLRDTSGPGRTARPEPRDESAEARARAVAEAAAAAERKGATAASTQAAEAAQQAAEFTAKVQRLEEELRGAREEAERSARTVRSLTASANAAARQRDDMAQQLADAERAREVEATELRAQVAALEERLLAVDSERARYQRVADARNAAATQSLQKLESERDALTERVAAAEQRAAALQSQLTAEGAERERLAAQVELLTAQVRAGAEALQRAQAQQAQERGTTEADRDAWKEQTITLRAQLAERSETLAGLDRELRGTSIARDAAVSQLQAARAEIDRLASLGEELSLRATQLDAARAAVLAEATTLQRALEEERGTRQRTEEALRTDLATARQEAERSAAEAATLAADVAERQRALAAREEQLATLRVEHETTRQAAADGQQATAELRAEVAALMARLDHGTAERQQLLDERTALRTALNDARQRASQADVAHASALGQIQAEAVELRRQVETLATERNAVTERLQRAVEEGRELTVRLAEAQRRNGDLHGLLQQRDDALEHLASERETLTAQAATSAGQLQAAQETLERTRAAAAQERMALEALRNEWQEQATTARDELGQRAERLAAVEHDLRAASVARDAAVAELHTARAEIDRLAGLADELKHAQTHLQAERAASAMESAAARRALDDERAARAETERALRTDLASARTEVERLSMALEARQHELNEGTQVLAERDTQLTTLRREVEALRQQSTDRGVLARQASELGSKVVELEQALAAAHGDAARAERQRAAHEERLEAARRREAESLAAANQERAALQEALQRRTEERAQAEAGNAALRGEIDGLRTAVAELQATLDATRAERSRAIEETGAATQRWSATQQRVEELDAALRERETALAAASTESQRFAAELATASAQLQSEQEALAAARLAAGEEREALAADRDTWRQHAVAARAEVERLAALQDEWRRQGVHADRERGALATELAALRQAFDQERAAHSQAADTVSAELASARAEVDRVVSEATTLRAALAERDAQVDALREREAAGQDAARQDAARQWQQERAALRAEIAALSARLEERDAESQQLRDGRAALEHQLMLVTASQGEAEQALAQGLDAARAQITQLEQERVALNAAVAESRQRLSQAQVAHDDALARADAEANQLRRQLQSLGNASRKHAQQLQEAEQALARHAEELQDERQRVHGLGERCAQLEQSLATAEAQRIALDADLASAHAEVGTLASRLEDSETNCQVLRDGRSALERELTVAHAGREEQQQTLIQQQQAAQQQVAELEQVRATFEVSLAETQRRMADSAAAYEQELAQTRAQAEASRQQMERVAASADALAERLKQVEQAREAEVLRVEEAGRRAAQLAERDAQLERSLSNAEERRTALEARLQQAQAEIDALRQQSDDRGVLAHQASELGRTVVELEQQLAALRGDVARAERERAAVVEELDEARRLQAAADAAAEQRHTALQAMVDRLSDDQQRIEAESAARLADADALRALLTSERAALDELRAERTRAQEEGQDAARRMSEMHRRLDELSARLAQREAAVEASTSERQRLSAQVGKLTSQLRAAQDALQTLEGRTALERAAAESERDTWKARAAAAQVEVERLSALAGELRDTASQLEAARSTGATESAALHRALEEARNSHRQAEATLRADLTAVQAEVERLSHDAVTQRTALLERDEQLAALGREQEAARVRDAEWQQTTAALRAEGAALTAQLRESGAETQQLRDAREALEGELRAAVTGRERDAQALQAARQQIGRLEGERGAQRDALDAAHRQGADAQAAHAAALEVLRGDVAALRNQLAATAAERTALSERLQHAEELVATQAKRAEQDRQEVAALNGRREQLEQAVAAAEARRAGLDAELAKARAEVQALRQQSADRGALAQQTGELAGRVRQLEEQLAAQQADSARIERQRTVLEEQLHTAREQQESAAVAAAREQAELREMLARLKEERRQLETERTERANTADTLRSQLTELRSTVGEFTVERERVREERQDVTERLSETQQRMAQLSQQLQQRDARLQSVDAERERFAAAARTAERASAELSRERDELRRTVEELTNQLEQARFAGTEEQAARARDLSQTPPQPVVQPGADEAAGASQTGATEAPRLYQGPLEIERSAPLGAALDGAPEPLETPAAVAARPHKAVVPSGELVLLDEGATRDAASAALRDAGFEVGAFPPTEAGVDEMLRRKVKCVMLNLGCGTPAWHTLRVLRERVGSRNLPILAYIMAKDAAAGFCFGRADFGLWPMDPARLIERLGRLRPKLKRLLTLSTDVDGMGLLREPLAQAKISTSIVLDGKQALEFATMVEPEAAILHLSPSCASAPRALAGLRSTETTRDLPLLVLLDKAPAPREDPFFTATTLQLLSKPAFQFTNLPEEIARVVG